MKHCVKGLETLGLKDDQDRPLCPEVLVVALRSRRYDSTNAADFLFTATEKLAPGTPTITAAHRAKAIAAMESRITAACLKEEVRDLRRSKRRLIREMRRR
jgi:hypothetical protein